MTRALLDVNVLLALLDRDHVHHDRARSWLSTQSRPDWASCAITQNGFVRIVSQAAYPNPISVAAACETLAHACESRLHEFWPCDVSILDGTVDPQRLLSPRTLTDVYLLGLAVKHDGRLVTFDRQVPSDAVVGANPAHLLTL